MGSHVYDSDRKCPLAGGAFRRRRNVLSSRFLDLEATGRCRGDVTVCGKQGEPTGQTAEYLNKRPRRAGFCRRWFVKKRPFSRAESVIGLARFEKADGCAMDEVCRVNPVVCFGIPRNRTTVPVLRQQQDRVIMIPFRAPPHSSLMVVFVEHSLKHVRRSLVGEC